MSDENDRLLETLQRSEMGKLKDHQDRLQREQAASTLREQQRQKLDEAWSLLVIPTIQQSASRVQEALSNAGVTLEPQNPFGASLDAVDVLIRRASEPAKVVTATFSRTRENVEFSVSGPGIPYIEPREVDRIESVSGERIVRALIGAIQATE